MEAKIKVVLATVILFAIIAGVFCFLYKPIYYRLYWGDRITGNLQVSLNGQPAALSQDNFHIISFAGEDQYLVKQENDRSQISIQGGKYGNYTFGVAVPGFSDTIKVTIMQFNWWNVTTFDLDIAIDTKTSSVLYTYSYTWLAENGDTQYENGTETDKIGEDELVIYLGG